MNVAALLQEAPSDDHRRRQQLRDQQQRQQQPSPERDRDRQLLPPPPNPQSQPPPRLPLHSPPPPSYYHQQPPRHVHPQSPPRSYPQESGGHPQAQRLPPPSAIAGIGDPYEVRHRRPEAESLPVHHEAFTRGHHGPPSLHVSTGPSSQPYTLEPRNATRSQPHHPHHGHPSAPSPMYIPPPQQSGPRALHSLPPKHAVSPTHGSGSVPLYPTQVGPGIGLPHPPSSAHQHSDSRAPPGYNEPSSMYNGHSGHPYAPPGASIMGALPPPPHHSHSHPQNSSHSQSRRRTGSVSDTRYNDETDSPAMGSLQRSGHGPFERDERERMDRERDGGPVAHSPHGPQGLGSQHGGIPGMSGIASSMMSMRGGPPPPPPSALVSGVLSGPGSAGVYAEREREREREREMGRARDLSREVERERERHRDSDRERQAEERMRERDRYMSMEEVEREREWARKQGQSQVQTPLRTEATPWSRFATPNPYSKMFDEAREREEEARERRLVSEKFPEMEEMRPREDWEQEKFAKQAAMNKQGGREKDMSSKERERGRDADRENRRERPKDTRRVSREAHGWVLEPRAVEGWPKNLERERERDIREQERQLQRERERDKDREFILRDEHDGARASRQVPAAHHHHLHHHHRHGVPNSQVHGSNSKSAKVTRPTDAGDMPIGPIGLSAQSGMGMPYGPMSNDRPPSGSQKLKVSNGHGPPLSIQPQHLHPSHHLMPGHPKGFPHRRGSPVPFTTSLVPTATFLPSNSPRPPLPPSLPALELGTFVYPHTPFPFLDFPYPTSEPTSTPNSPTALSDKEVREIKATILIPSGFLPTKRPQHPRIWGGASIPSFIPLFATPHLLNHIQSGMSYQFRKPHPAEIQGFRRVYTDDSDLFLCALHAGLVKWSTARAARKEGKDLKLEVRLTREARYVGGFGSHFVGGTQDEEDFTGEDDGRTLLSAGWGNSHDGSGVEILNAEFVKKGTAHAYSFQNRNQRILEYTDRHYALTCTRQSRKRRRILYQATEIEGMMAVEAADAKLCSDRTIVIGGQTGWSHVGFAYNPEFMKVVLFPTSPSKSRGRSRTPDDALYMDIDEGPRAPDVLANDIDPPSVFAYTKTETFLIYPQATEATSPTDATDGSDRSAILRYTIAVITQTVTASQTASEKSVDVSASLPASSPSSSSTSHPLPKEATKEKRPLEEQSPDGVTDMSMSPTEVSKTSVRGEPAEDPAAVPTSSAGETPRKADDAQPSQDHVPEISKSNAQDNAPMLDPVAATENVAKDVDLKREQPNTMQPPVQSAATETVSEVEASPVTSVATSLPQKDNPPTLQVLQRDLTAEQFIFDLDGVGVVSKEVEDGGRKGWKIEVRSWRVAGTDALPLMKSVM